MTVRRERWGDVEGKRPAAAQRVCEMPGCVTRFAVGHPDQCYCGKACRVAHDALIRKRGAQIVRPLLAWRAGKSVARKDDPRKILATKALTFIGREVREWMNEDLEADARARETAG